MVFVRAYPLAQIRNLESNKNRFNDANVVVVVVVVKTRFEGSSERPTFSTRS